MNLDFCHIVPINHLSKVSGRNHHLTLAHLVEQSDEYTNFYVNEKVINLNCSIILDNSAFEMYKQGRPMYPAEKLIEMGHRINADYVVLSDYPAEHYSKTIEAAKDLAPQFKRAGLGTFFVPQSEIGDLDGLVESFIYAATNPLIDYIGVSILSIPNAYGVEKNNKLQRYLSRYDFCELMNGVLLNDVSYWDYISLMGKKIHFLGMVDGPNEISLVRKTGVPINTWDSSAAVWAGLNGISFDHTPTGLVNGKFEQEVDFFSDIDWSSRADHNMLFIEELVEEFNEI